MKINDCNIEVENKFHTEMLYLRKVLTAGLEKRLAKYVGIDQTPEVRMEMREEIQKYMDQIRSVINSY